MSITTESKIGGLCTPEKIPGQHISISRLGSPRESAFWPRRFSACPLERGRFRPQPCVLAKRLKEASAPPCGDRLTPGSNPEAFPWFDKAFTESYAPIMSRTLAPPKKVWTEEELQALPDDGYIYEVVAGELVMSPKNNPEHGEICAELLTALRNFAKQKKLGVVWDSSTGFWMRNRNCRAPDISFLSKTRLIGLKRPMRKFFEGSPDLAVEILVPSNTPQEINERLQDFFTSGTQIAWVIHPEEQFIEICHSPTQRKILGPGAVLDGEHLLPGFQYPIADLFKDWDWE